MRSQVADQLLKSGVVRAVRVGTRAVPWYRFIKLTVTDRKGDEALKGEDWAAKHIDHNATGEDNLVRFLGKGSSWCLSPEDTQHLPIGEYSVGAIFDTLGVDNESDVRQLKLHSNALGIYTRSKNFR